MPPFGVRTTATRAPSATAAEIVRAIVKQNDNHVCASLRLPIRWGEGQFVKSSDFVKTRNILSASSKSWHRQITHQKQARLRLQQSWRAVHQGRHRRMIPGNTSIYY